MQIRFVGCGDAFGSGGRFNTCFHLTGKETNLLVDCGASSLIALKRQGVERNAIRAILITHFHADHFGGIPFFMLDAQFFAKRRAPLVIAGPEGLRDWYVRALETAFPGSSGAVPKFELSLMELTEREPATIAGAEVTPFRVNHGQPGGPFFAYRIAIEGKVFAYTGDTEWTDAIIDAARDADLLVAEAYFRDKPVSLHLDLASLERRLGDIRPKRLILTHMSDPMLAEMDALSYETAEDGLVVDF